MASTGYFTQMVNTAISGSSLYSNLSGNDVRLLEFDAVVQQPPGLAVTVLATAAVNTLDVDQIVQAAIRQLGVDGTSAPAGNTGGYITLGPDAISQSSAYVSLFNLQSTNDVRTLTFQMTARPTNGTGIVYLANNNLGSGTATYVQILRDGATGSSQQILFNSGVGAGSPFAANWAGLRRTVLVSSNNLSSGAEVVQFNILSGSL